MFYLIRKLLGLTIRGCAGMTVGTATADIGFLQPVTCVSGIMADSSVHYFDCFVSAVCDIQVRYLTVVMTYLARALGIVGGMNLLS